MRFYYLILLLLVPFIVMGENHYNERIKNLKNIPDKCLTDSIKGILYKLSLERGETEMLYTRAMLATVNVLKGENYFLVLRHYAKIAPSNNQTLLDSCLRYALNHNLGSYVSSLLVLKSTFFKNAGIYDSAMVCTLRARDEADKYGNIEQKGNVLHLLGDLYFSTGLYAEAKRYYAEVQEIKGSKEVWNSWRQRVIRNNMGLIEMKDGNYYKALGLFDESLKESGKERNTKLDSLSLAYIYLLKAQALFCLKDYQKTNAYIDSSLAISEKTDDHSSLFALYVLKARLSLITGNAKKAKGFIDCTNSFAGTALMTQEERNGILLLRSNIYETLGEPDKAFAYMRSYAMANDSLFKELNFAQISQIQSEDEYELFKIKYEDIRTEKTLYFLFGIGTIIVISIISMMNLRIRQKNRKLVALVVNSVSTIKKPAITVSGVPVKWEDIGNISATDDKQQRLITELSRLIETGKLYLQSDFSLQKAAEMLGTNRTYLSKAINFELKQSFTNYINSLRIKEAIRLISQSKAAKYNITGLSVNVGFGSRASFESSFFKHTGMLPSVFVSNYQQILKDSNKPSEDRGL